MSLLYLYLFLCLYEWSCLPMQRIILFVDDNDILYRSGTRRILSQPNGILLIR